MTDEELIQEVIHTIRSKTSPRAVLLEDRIEKTLGYLEQVATPSEHTVASARRFLMGENDDLPFRNPAALLRDLFERRFICRVVSTGYNNGARCDPSDPHGPEWRCGYYWTAGELTEKQAREYGLITETKETTT